MSLIRLNRNIATKIKTKRFFATATLGDGEYTATPNYPPILDLSYEKRLERKKQSVHEEIKAVKTVEEKQIKLNMPKYYGFKCYMFYENSVPYDSLRLAQHITRTHLIVKDELPVYFNNINVDELLKEVKSDIEEALIFEYNGYRRKHEINNSDLSPTEVENIVSSSICRQINRLLMNNMLKSYPHLLNTQVDYDPRIESFWFAGGMNPPENIKRYRTGVEWRKHMENNPTDRAIQYIGTPSITLRSDLPLLPVVSFNEADNTDFDVPHFQYDPRVIGTSTQHRRAVNIPGFWPGETNQFGLMSYHGRGHILPRDFNDPLDSKEAIHRQGILASFGWLNAQANFLGFTTFNDITYPLVTQSVVTNGQLWSFYVYQLNTLLVHSKYATENPKKNICWATTELKLFDEIKEGKVIGFNDDVLRTLLKFYANVPEERLGVNLRPYLSHSEKLVADYEDDDKRQWLEREYKFLVSNRPRFKLEYELYHWEKIYKVDHQTRGMEKRLRPFELFIKPSNRRLDDRQAFYVPRALRPHLPKNKGRYRKEYFP